MLRLLIVLLLFSLSIYSHSALATDGCVNAVVVPLNGANSQASCNQLNVKVAMKDADTAKSQVMVTMHLSKRQPSPAESLLAMIFIPGLILLWILRFARSDK